MSLTIEQQRELVEVCIEIYYNTFEGDRISGSMVKKFRERVRAVVVSPTIEKMLREMEDSVRWYKLSSKQQLEVKAEEARNAPVEKRAELVGTMLWNMWSAPLQETLAFLKSFELPAEEKIKLERYLQEEDTKRLQRKQRKEEKEKWVDDAHFYPCRVWEGDKTKPIEFNVETSELRIAKDLEG